MGVEGKWYNELNSEMQLTVSAQVIKGTYVSTVGVAEYQYDLIGFIDTAPYDFSQAIAWTVVWNNAELNAHSVTAWSGQYQVNEKTGEEEIITIWLLTREQEAENDWASTLVGQDIYKRNPPTEEQRSSRQLRAYSHPIIK
jgi:hypothetical protein